MNDNLKITRTVERKREDLKLEVAQISVLVIRNDREQFLHDKEEFFNKLKMIIEVHQDIQE